MVSSLIAGNERIDATLGAANAHFSRSEPTLPALMAVSRCQRLLLASKPHWLSTGVVAGVLGQ